MKKIDAFRRETSYLDLDGHALQLLLCVHECGSITQAAQRLGMTQSAVSHALDRLRGLVGDPLFVKSGRGIVPTARAHSLAAQARTLLDELRAFSWSQGVSPERLRACFTIAANDLQRDVLLPPLLQVLRTQAPGVTLRVIPSGAPQPALLRDGECHLVLTPRPPEGSDIVQRRLFDDEYRVFYDPQHRPPPQHLDDYLAADHVSVLYEPRRSLEVDDWLTAQHVHRRIIALVPGFAGLAALLRAGPWLATAPHRLSQGVLRGLAHVPTPISVPPLAMYMVWHLRHQHDPVHTWLRQTLLGTMPPPCVPDRSFSESTQL